MVDELPDDIEKIWYQIGQLASGLHQKWNILEPQLQKAGVSKTSIDGFEENLTSTTLLITTKEGKASLLGLNELSNSLYGFTGHFKSKTPTEVMQIAYHIREAVLLASEDDFSAAIRNTEKAKELGEGLRQRLTEKDASDIAQKFELSMEDIRKALDTENFQLIQIKGAIVIKNVVEMEETFESGSK